MTQAVGATELFKFATTLDKFLMLLGTVGAIVQGSAFPVNMVNFGDVIDIFLDYSLHLQNITNPINVSIMVLPHAPLDKVIMPYIYWFVGVGVASFISSFIAVSCWQLAAERQVNTIRKKFFYALMRQQISWFDLHDTREISSMFAEDINKIAEGMGEKMAVSIQWISTWFGAYIMALTRSWKLTLGVIIFSPILAFFGSTIIRVMRNMAAKESKAYAKAGAIVEQALRSIWTVHAFQGQEKEIMKYEGNLNEAVRVASRKGLVLGLGHSVVWFLLFTMFSGIMWLGTYLIQNDNLEPGKIIPVFFGVSIGSLSLGNAFSNLENFSNARGSATKVFDIIAMLPTIDSFSTEGLKPPTLHGRIEFKNVQFSYPARPDIQVLGDLNLTIEPGESVALVGPSGCGKSTTVQLVQRFYDCNEGSILIDGHNIKDLNLKWLREQIAVVSQEPVLFDVSIEDNIRLGKLDATDSEIHQAAREANAHGFIKALPQGYRTKVGERGAKLSGGQKQRISIARALVRNPKILLLDEATSALDHESEAMVQDALDKAEKGRTTIIIAHRLSTIKYADKIVAISGGMIIEQGTHNELLKQEGLYCQLVQIQTMIIKNSNIDIGEVEIIMEDESHANTFSGDVLLRAPLKRITSSKLMAADVNLIARTSVHRRTTIALHEEQIRIPETIPKDVKLSEIMRYNVPEWPLIMFGCIACVIAGAVHPTFSFLMSDFIKLFDITDRNEQWEKVHILSGLVIGLAAMSAVVRTIQDYCFSKSGAHLTARLRKLTFTSMVNQDMEYFDLPNNQVGSLASRLSGDASMVQGATGSRIGQILEAVLTLVISAAIAFVYGWKLALVVLSFMPPMIMSGIVHGKTIIGAAKKDREQLEQAGKVLRKRLNKSSSNSSSLHYVDWDPSDGAFDPDVANGDGHRHFVSKQTKQGAPETKAEKDPKGENAEDDSFNMQNLFFKMYNRNQEDPPHSVSPGNQNSGLGVSRDPDLNDRANHSLPGVEEFVNKFQAKYKSSLFAVDSSEKYVVVLKRLIAQRKKGVRLPAYVHDKGTLPWERFHYGIRQFYLYDAEDVNIDRMLSELVTNDLISVEQKEGGTQIKLIMTFENEGQALFKPMRYGREQETLPDHFYFADFERHNAEIAAYHLDKVLGYYRVPPTIGRLMNVSGDIERVADKKLAKTFFISPAGNLCFHGSCSYYCDSSHPVCGHPMMLEGSLAAFLPPTQLASRKTWRNPWKRSYSKHKKAYWEVYDDLCEKVKDKHPYNEGRRLLDVLDMSVFDFLSGNLDRHHYETFRDFGNDTFILHLDNGRAFGKSKYDCMSCLAPVRQCCMIRLSTLTKLVKFYLGPDSLSHLMKSSMKSDPLNPILLESHLSALDRRVSKILHVISECLKNGLGDLCNGRVHTCLFRRLR